MKPAAEIARLRQGLYRFFAGAFAPPQPVRLGELVAAAEYLEAMDLSGYAFYREWRALASLLESDLTVMDMAAEHVRLFASGTDGVLCPPIESYYRSHGRREAIADVVAAVEQDYRDLGLITIGSSDPPDHLVTQLEIMSTLCARESASRLMQLEVEATDLLDAEARFLHRHLTAWLPDLRARVHAAGPSDFYAALVDAVHAYVTHDRDLIAGLRRWSGATA